MIHVVVPSYDCMEWLPRCLDSIESQGGVDFRVIVVDDASPPPQSQYVYDRCERTPGWEAFLNASNMKCPRNLWRAIPTGWMVDPGDVVVLVDGDDWLPHDGVLARIAEVYAEDPECQLTYGSYEVFGGETPNPAEPYPEWVVESGAYRLAASHFNHLITFRVGLWKQLEIGDLQFSDGTLLDTAYDCCIMFPLLELARGRYRFLDEPLYVYNASNPQSESITRLELSFRTGLELWRRAPKVPWSVPSVGVQHELMARAFRVVDSATFEYPNGYTPEMAAALSDQLRSMGLEHTVVEHGNLVFINTRRIG